MKITAVEYLVDRLVESGVDFLSEEIEFINQAKEMEKQQKGYSEEEVIHIVQRLMYDVHCGDITDTDFIVDFKISPIKWFEQFKKK